MSKEDGRSPKALIKSVFPNWTDFDVTSLSDLLVELCTYVGDVLSFEQDRVGILSPYPNSSIPASHVEGLCLPRSLCSLRGKVLAARVDLFFHQRVTRADSDLAFVFAKATAGWGM